MKMHFLISTQLNIVALNTFRRWQFQIGLHLTKPADIHCKLDTPRMGSLELTRTNWNMRPLDYSNIIFPSDSPTGFVYFRAIRGRNDLAIELLSYFLRRNRRNIKNMASNGIFVLIQILIMFIRHTNAYVRYILFLSLQ